MATKIYVNCWESRDMGGYSWFRTHEESVQDYKDNMMNRPDKDEFTYGFGIFTTDADTDDEIDAWLEERDLITECGVLQNPAILEAKLKERL